MKVHYPRWLGTLVACTIAMLMMAPAMAQDYGIGDTRIVAQAPDSIPLDGVYEADIWDLGALVDLKAEADFFDAGLPDDVVEAWARVLYREDTLFVYAFIDDNEVFAASEDIVWQSDQILVGIDPIHEAGVSDTLVAVEGDDAYAGWPENAPDQGPYVIKAYPAGDGGAFTLNWGFAGTDPVAEGWVDGTVWIDEENQDWGIEAAFYVPTIETGAQIGFNIGGAQASEAACTTSEIQECAYGYFSQWAVELPGSDIQSRTASYATLQMGAGGEGYGSGLEVDVPMVDAGVITIDGVADEAAWGDAFDDIDMVANFSSYGTVGDPLEGPDLFGETRLLWTEDTLYVYHHVFDTELFWGDDPWASDMILMGLDPSAEGDTLFGPDFDGGLANAPSGPHTYFINDPLGFTIGWSEDVVPSDTGWVNGVVFRNDELAEWGFEAAFYIPEIEEGAQIGFDIGGANSNQVSAETDFDAYAYFAWQSGTGGTDPGAINREASQWALLNFVVGTAIERSPEVPGAFALEQNYPNPFNPSTTIEFGLKRSGHVNVSVFNALGQRVATLADGVEQAGTYRVEWDATGVPSGVYLYQMEVDGEVVQARKMVLMR